MKRPALRRDVCEECKEAFWHVSARKRTYCDACLKVVQARRSRAWWQGTRGQL